MELKGKKINFLGDSITEGTCASSPEFSYVQVLQQICGLSKARNYGLGGTRIARQQAPSAIEQYDLDFCMRSEQMDPDADIIIIFGGTNDHGHGDAPIGTPSDRTPDTFYGACHVLFQSLIQKYPASLIVVLTPLHRVEEDSPKGPLGWKLSHYVDALKKTAAEYRLPVLDLFETSAIRAHIPEIASQLTTDGLHPNDKGHAILAREIKAFLEEL